MTSVDSLPRRQREIFEILCVGDALTAQQVRERMRDAPSYSAVRTLLGRLETRGLVTHDEGDGAFVYRPVIAAEQARKSVLTQMVKTFFDGSAVSAATALLGLSRTLDEKDIAALERAVADARERSQ